MLYSKLAISGSGLSNQIFSLITSIIIGIKNGNKVIVVENFLTDYSKTNTANISQILNIDKINKFLYTKYGIIIVDKCNVDLKINYITYGTNNSKYYLTNYYKYPFTIPKETSFNSICGDPVPNVQKQLIVNYTINGYTIEEIYAENLTNDIIFDIKNANYVNTFAWINTYDKTIFEDILVNIIFNDELVNQANNIISYINKPNKINVIHLRVENDAIQHWSKMNQMNEQQFKNIIETKYINLFKKYISRTDLNIILTSSKSNGVFNFLQNENYQYVIVNKLYEDRELNAIIDLLVSTSCNNKFIGNFNFKYLNGSTFSYYISKLINTNIEKIMIDLDRIINEEQIFKQL